MQNILTHLVARQALRYGSRTAVGQTDGRTVTYTSWTGFAGRVEAMACAMEAMGVKEQECIGEYTANREALLVTDFAAFANRAVPVPVYATSTPEQLAYIVRDAGIRFLFVGSAEQYAAARTVQRTAGIELRIVTYEDVTPEPDDTQTVTFETLLQRGREASPATHEAVAARRRAATEADLAAIIYTSGTTGEPKGAMLPHSCFNAAIIKHRERLSMLSEADTSVSFLPLSHIFERAWTYYCLHTGMQVTVNINPHDIQTAVALVRPTCMCAVPRFWEKVYTAVQEKLARMPLPRRLVASRALSVGRRRNLDYLRRGRSAPRLLEWQYRLFDRLVFKPMKHAIGIDHGNIFPTAGAALSPVIVEFFRSCGINILIGYGLSETTATVTCFPQTGYEIGTAGTPLPGIEVRIGEQDEIQIKSPTVMSGYYGKPQATAEAFTPDGWFRTGDAGHIDATGALTITERLKDLFKTSNGKYIAPQALESRLGQDKYIEQVAVIGDSRKYVTAIIIPAFDALKEYAREKGIEYGSLDELVRNPEVSRMFEERIDRLQNGLASFEKIKKFTLLPKAFTMESGELTNTLKIRRPVINTRYSREIEAMYA